MLLERIQALPKGYSEVEYNNRKYGVTRSDFNNGKSYKVYAEELGGNDFISLNFYITQDKENLKPCEMPQQKVIHFLMNYILIETSNNEDN
ncbi:peptide methionine sulfoxide reductase [Galbibacter mesophilus]|uniref:peptide methionine sulfoxide reductase n=1 Tax=Galbibacter mesophilus TaxID=379069 RepID=UPI00191E0EC7|nr:peptide methionine sulfoxide reductase [Galbibacter mesophilus]MCM5663854.1 peptide methionine sulfoxide reductase [Galbibacter mesophilus]